MGAFRGGAAAAAHDLDLVVVVLRVRVRAAQRELRRAARVRERVHLVLVLAPVRRGGVPVSLPFGAELPGLEVRDVVRSRLWSERRELLVKEWLTGLIRRAEVIRFEP